MKAFSSEITTGMSAPPIGRTKTIPNRAATPIAAASSQNSTVPIATAASAIDPTNRSALPTCWAGYVIGRPLISSWSFPKATSEPEKEIEPTSAEMTVATPRSTPTSPACAQTLWNSTSETRAAAPPPTPLNSATICGIAVIFTFFAPTTPITEPISIPAAIHHQPGRPLSSPSVTRMAQTIPAAPIWTPRRAWRGDERKRSARMNATIVTRYSRFAVVWLTRPCPRAPRAS